MGRGIIRGENTVFAVGYLFATTGAAGNAGDNFTDDVPFAQLQEISFKDTLGMKELMGSTQLTAISVGASERKLNGDAKSATVRSRYFQLLRGGDDPTYDIGDDLTTFVAGINDEPFPFNLHLMSPDDGSDMEIKIYNCLSPELNLAFKLRDYLIPDFTWMAYGNPDTGKLYEVILPGDQTSN